MEIKVEKGSEEKVDVNISGNTLGSLVESSRSLKVNIEGSTVTIPANVLADILGENKEAGKLELSVQLNAEVKAANGDTLSNVVELKLTYVNDDASTSISTFSKKVEVTLPLPTTVTDLDKVAVYYVDENGELHYVESKVVGNTIVFKTNHFSKFAIVENNVTFSDLAKYDWARKFIESLASKTIIKGKASDQFAPGDQITREEFAVLLVRALDIPTAEYEGLFTDVAKDKWSALQIEAANRAGIVVGNAGKFNPSNNITREEMVTMIIRALKYNSSNALKDVSKSVTFLDAKNISGYANENVGYAVNLGIINGIEANGGFNFAPKANATRAEAAKMLYQLLEKLN